MLHRLQHFSPPPSAPQAPPFSFLRGSGMVGHGYGHGGSVGDFSPTKNEDLPKENGDSSMDSSRILITSYNIL